MVIREKEVNGTNFRMELIFDDKHSRLVNDVLEWLEDLTIAVPDTDKKWKPPWENSGPIDDHEIILNRLQTWLKPKDYPWEKLTSAERGLIEIPVLECLPIVCGSIAFDTTFGKFSSPVTSPIVYGLDLQRVLVNARIQSKDLFDYISSIDPNFCYSAGSIELDRELKQSEDAFRFVLARRLKQAIDKLEIVYPALTDWNSFCKNVLELGSRTSEDFYNRFTKERMSDSKDPDLDELETYFGNIVDIWHRGYEKLVSVTN